MKTSNKLLLTATLIGFGYLALFDFQLKAEYNKGEFRKPTYNRTGVSLKPFTTIVNKSGNIIELEIKEGPKSEIWMEKSMKEEVAINQHNDTLFIDYRYDKSQGTSVITIICPAVNSVITQKHISSNANWDYRTATIWGFTQDVMNITAGSNTHIELKKNILNKLNANTTESNASLIIHNDNQIKSANINILGKSDLELFTNIAGANYSYTDSATIKLNGKSFHQLQQR